MSLAPKAAFANVAQSQTDQVLVRGVGQRKIRVIGMRLTCGATATNVTFNSQAGNAAGVACSETFQDGINGGISSPPAYLVGYIHAYDVPFLFETSEGQNLTVTTGAGSTTGVGVSYIEV